MKRIVLSVIAGVVVFGSVLGFAASLTTTSGTLGEGGAAVASCGTAALTYNSSYDSVSGKYRVDSVDVRGLDGCASSKVTVSLLGASNAKLGDGQSPVSTVAASATNVLLDEKPLAADVIAARVVIHNGDSSTTVATA